MGGIKVGNGVFVTELNCPDEVVNKGASDTGLLACRGIGKDPVMHVEVGLGAIRWLAGIPCSKTSCSSSFGLLRILMSKSRSIRLPSSLLLIIAVKAAEAAATTSGSTPGITPIAGFSLGFGVGTLGSLPCDFTSDLEIADRSIVSLVTKLLGKHWGCEPSDVQMGNTNSNESDVSSSSIGVIGMRGVRLSS